MARQLKPNRYVALIERIFNSRYQPGATEVRFERIEIEKQAKALRIKLPKNLGDLIYSFRYRAELPESIRAKAPPGTSWIIRSVGRSQYVFIAASVASITPNKTLTETKVPDATPGVIEMYALSDEQSLLAKLRYNRLIDVFTGITCYSLQSHLRTAIAKMGQIETDEVYVGLDRRGVHYVIPVQAKGGKDVLSVVQIEQDIAMCASKFPQLVCRPIGAQFMANDLIALFEFEEGDKGVGVSGERHYRLVAPDQMTPEDLETYRRRSEGA